MKRPELWWCGAERFDLPDLVAGGRPRLGERMLRRGTMFGGRDAVAVAYSRSDGGQLEAYNPPALLVLRTGAVAETLSWLLVYAREAFPLSQFARVLSSDDWQLFEHLIDSETVTHANRWASIVLGEVLGQGEIDTELSTLPLSRSVACFTTAIARAEIAHGRSFEVSQLCSERLRTIEADRRFVSRSVASADMYPIWAMAGFPDVSDAAEVAEAVVGAAMQYSLQHDAPSRLPGLRDFPELFGDSAEERVRAFQRLSAAVESEGTRSRTIDSAAAAALAAGAFLVGRGTSHAFLLRKSPRHTPLACAWFGLMAALGGPDCWDVQWGRAARGIERQLRATFLWEDPPNADICWAEYKWLPQGAKRAQPFLEISRLVAKTLAIEIVPGAVCQFRVATGDESHTETHPAVRPQSVAREKELQAALEQFLSLAARTRVLLEGSEARKLGNRPQADLPFDAKGGPSTRLGSPGKGTRGPARG